MKSLRVLLCLSLLGAFSALFADNVGVERTTGQPPSLVTGFDAYNRNLAVTPGSFTIDLRNHFTIPEVNAAQLVQLKTNFGTINIELLANDAPQTVANFKSYLATDATSAADRAKTYDNTIIHRSVPGFIIQGGGFRLTGDLATLEKKPAVTNEFKVANTRGTIAMAKLDGQPNSATNQWFINLDDNREILDNQNGGFTAFARVIGAGMDVVDDIAEIDTFNIRDSEHFSDFFATHPDGVAFDEVPLDDYDGSANLLLSSFVTVQSARLLPLHPPTTGNGASIITYSLTNSDPAFVKTVLANGRLRVTPPKYPGQSVITLRASEAAGSYAEGSFTLVRVGAPVLIKALPPFTDAPLGQTATLVAQVGAWPLNIKWQRRSSASAPWEDFADDDRYTGSTTRSLQIKLPGATPLEAAASLALTGVQFRFVVANTINEVTRTLEGKPTTLRVVPSLAFKDKLAKTTAGVLGDNVTLVARAADATLPAASYQWQRLPAGANPKVEANWQNLANAAAASGDIPAVLSPYSGVTTHTLTISLKGTTPATGTGISVADTLALDKSQYRCVITHDRGTGPVSAASTATTLRITTLPVGFAAQPPKFFSGLLGGNASVSVTSLGVKSNTPLTYKWQRLAPGLNPKIAANWIDVVNTTDENPTRYTGATTRTLTISLAHTDDAGAAEALALSDSQYRCVIQNILGSATSTPATLRVVAQRFSLVTFEDRSLPGLADDERSYTAKGLPKGLALNGQTGHITGTASATGVYRVVVTIRVAGAVVETRVYYVEVNGLSGNNAGGFEAFLSPGGDAAPPYAKLSLLISSNGAFTGVITTSAEAKPLPIKGAVKRDAATGRLFLAKPVALTRPGSPASARVYLLDFEISSAGVLSADLATAPSATGAETDVAATDDENLPGVQLGSFAGNAAGAAPWAKVTGSYTLAFTDAAPLAVDPHARPVPAGSGYATAIMYYNGVLELRGKTGDGVPFTAALPTGEDASYRLFVRSQHRAAAGAYLAANLPLTKPSADSTRYSIAPDGRSDAYWAKPGAVAKTPNYSAGFGPLGLTVRMEPWGNVSYTSIGMKEDGADLGKLVLRLTGSVDNTGANPRSLPLVVKSSNEGVFSAVSTPDSSEFTGKLNFNDGSFSGTLKLMDQTTGAVGVVRTVPIEGVFLQIPTLTADTIVNEGMLLIPAFDPATGSTTGPITTARIQLLSLPAD